MAQVPVTINGVAYPKNKKDPPMPVTIVGYAWLTGLTPDQSPPADQPGIWGPNDPRPTPPIAMPPAETPPPDIPTTPSDPKPPPPGGGWGWSPTFGWGYFPGSGGAGPKR